MAWIIFHQSSLVEVLTSDVAALKTGILKRWLQSKEVIWVGLNPIELVFLQEEEETLGWVYTKQKPYNNTEKVAICKQSNKDLGEIKPTDTLILDFQTPEVWENKFLLFKPIILWHFVMVALAE